MEGRESDKPRRIQCNSVRVADPTLFVTETQRRRENGQIKKGEVRNPAGRPKGSRATFAEAFMADVQMHWLVHGKDVIERVAQNDPSTYLRVAAGLLPRELNVTVSVLDTMSDDDLMTLLQGIRERRRASTAKAIDVTPVTSDK